MAPKINTEIVTLHDGSKMPAVGYGTWLVSEDDSGYQNVLTALKAGYRHIDTAYAYRNEAQVGRAVRDSGIPREEIFVVTKLTGSMHRDPAEALDISLKNLGLDYVDLYLMHWPLPTTTSDQADPEWTHVQTWHAMQKLPKSKTRSIGVSNYTTDKFEELFSDPGTTVVPSCNQVELHPYLAQNLLTEYCAKKNITLAAYCPLGRGRTLLDDPLLLKIAKSHDATAAQVALSWGLHRGYIVLPKSSTDERIVSNLHTVELTDAEIEQISKLSHGKRLVSNPTLFKQDDAKEKAAGH